MEDDWEKSSYCTDRECVEVQLPKFYKSKKCDTGGCVEVGIRGGVWIRNSNYPSVMLYFSAGDWDKFLGTFIHGAL